MSHTPRKWKVHRAIWDQETGDVAYILEGVKEARAADSYLINAAPDMFEALDLYINPPAGMHKDSIYHEIASALAKAAFGEDDLF